MPGPLRDLLHPQTLAANPLFGRGGFIPAQDAVLILSFPRLSFPLLWKCSNMLTWT
jgi:hypothetical protein